METSYLKAHPFWSHDPEWMPNLPLRSWLGFEPMRLGIPRTPKAQAVPLYHDGMETLHFTSTFHTPPVLPPLTMTRAPFSHSTIYYPLGV